MSQKEVISLFATEHSYTQIARNWIVSRGVDVSSHEWRSGRDVCWEFSASTEILIRLLLQPTLSGHLTFEFKVTFTLGSEEGDKILHSSQGEDGPYFALEINPSKVTSYWIRDSTQNFTPDEFLFLLSGTVEMIEKRISRNEDYEWVLRAPAPFEEISPDEIPT